MDKEKSLPLFLSNTFDSRRLVENKMEGWQVIKHENKFRIIKESRMKVFDIHFSIIKSIFNSYILNESKLSQQKFLICYLKFEFTITENYYQKVTGFNCIFSKFPVICSIE